MRSSAAVKAALARAAISAVNLAEILTKAMELPDGLAAVKAPLLTDFWLFGGVTKATFC